MRTGSRKHCLSCDYKLSKKRLPDPDRTACARCQGPLDLEGTFLKSGGFIADARDALWRALVGHRGVAKAPQKTISVSVPHSVFPPDIATSWMRKVRAAGRNLTGN